MSLNQTNNQLCRQGCPCGAYAPTERCTECSAVGSTVDLRSTQTYTGTQLCQPVQGAVGNTQLTTLGPAQQTTVRNRQFSRPPGHTHGTDASCPLQKGGIAMLLLALPPQRHCCHCHRGRPLTVPTPCSDVPVLLQCKRPANTHPAHSGCQVSRGPQTNTSPQHQAHTSRCL